MSSPFFCIALGAQSCHIASVSPPLENPAALVGAVADLPPLVERLQASSPPDASLQRDLEKFARAASLLAEEAELATRHDLRNRLNHLFGLAQLMRLNDAPPAWLSALDDCAAGLERCLAALSTPSSSSMEAGLASSQADVPASVQEESRLDGHLLVADDDAENREILRRLLEPKGFRLAFAENGVETIAQMERHEFDAVLLDIQMPEMDGFEVLSRLRESGRLGNTPVIVVTGLQEEQDAVRCIENGAEDFLSRPIRPALLMARLSASLEKKRLREKVFEQHFTPELARELARNPDPMKMQARQAEVTVLFCDIRGFSSISERLGPAQTVDWLSGVMGEFSSIVLDHCGVLVDYTGDELLAMWGAPNEQPDHAGLACNAALEILKRLPDLDAQWRPLIGAETAVGIGINSGEALVGNIGTHRKFKYGPLGTAVNLASRVQGATKFFGTPLLLTGDTVSRLRGALPVRRLCRVRVHNIAAPVDLYTLDEAANSGEGLPHTSSYALALEAFEQADFAQAAEQLEAYLNAVPEDGPARLLRSRIHAELTRSSGHFDPVWSLPGK